MSIGHNTYVGPYIKVYNPETNSTKIVNGCAWNKCQQHGIPSSSNYCPICGNPIIEIEVPIKKKIYINVHTELDDKLCNPYIEHSPENLKDYDIYIPNIKGYGEHFDNQSQIYEYEILEHSLSQVCNFNISLENEILKLKVKFGTDNVNTKYGVLGYLD